jgi:hypothetical protein
MIPAEVKDRQIEGDPAVALQRVRVGSLKEEGLDQPFGLTVGVERVRLDIDVPEPTVRQALANATKTKPGPLLLITRWHSIPSG